MGDIEVSRVSLVHATPTHLSAEGNVSETLKAIVTNSAMDPNTSTRGDK